MVLKILGTGCQKCKTLEKNAYEAVKLNGLDVSIEKVEDIPSIMGYGVMSTPALVLNEKVVSSGKVLTPQEIAQLIQQN
ncbi:thioredoxin family protein [Ferviditalea candida]|uniref:Thioredoxin family protein n=1 Tax=Ferviditalea candida TaxID=3108399 RepID=A0ABU5ZKG8_9BACL|nr:thioredoxin family protein [Paenibacillaceae bacterium T2]